MKNATETLKKIFSWNEIQSSHRLMFLIVLVLGLINFLWGEKVPAGNGLGSDGVVYGGIIHSLGRRMSRHI